MVSAPAEHHPTMSEPLPRRLATPIACFILAATTCLAACSQMTGSTDESRPAPPPAPAPADVALPAGLDARIASEGEAFSGVVLVARDGLPIYQKAVGLADREHVRANTLDTRFDLASLGKMFTGVAVLQLVQAGKVRLDAPLGTYLTDYPNQDLARQVTIHQLLTHTGGTGNVFWPEFAAHGNQLGSLEDYVARYGNRPPLFEPGSRWQYSNYGFVLLGLVIERVSGQSYFDYVAEHVFSPAGMTHTDFAVRGSRANAADDRAIGYTHHPREGQPPSAELIPNTSIVPYRGGPAGGAYSTAGDLLAFANALESHRLLDTQHTELLTTGKAPKPDGGKYAYGFSDATDDGVRCIGHSGGGPGMHTHLRICRAPGETTSHLVAVLANLDPPAGKDLMRAARESFAPKPPNVASVDPPAGKDPMPAARDGFAPKAPTAANASQPCQDIQDIALDDFEDGDVSVSPSGLGTSNWYSYHDLSGSTLLPQGELGATPSDDSKYAVHISGKLAATRTWAGIALEPSSETSPFDLSPWTHVWFRARGSGRMRFHVADVNTTPGGGVCQRCNDNFGANITLSERWTEHCVPFDALSQLGWGDSQLAFTPTKVFGLRWSMHTPSSAYDLWVDDVRLMCRRSAPGASRRALHRGSTGGTRW